MLRRIIIGVAATVALITAVPAAANAAVFRTEDQAERYMSAQYGDYYEDDGFSLDDVSCDGYGRVRDGGDDADDRYTKFECESDFSDEDGESGVTDTDRLKARVGGFKLRNLDSDWW
jgi:hypothetical protein